MRFRPHTTQVREWYSLTASESVRLLLARSRNSTPTGLEGQAEGRHTRAAPAVLSMEPLLCLVKPDGTMRSYADRWYKSTGVGKEQGPVREGRLRSNYFHDIFVNMRQEFTPQGNTAVQCGHPGE